VNRAIYRVSAEGDLWGRNLKSEAPSLKRFHLSIFDILRLCGFPLMKYCRLGWARLHCWVSCLYSTYKYPSFSNRYVFGGETQQNDQFRL